MDQEKNTMENKPLKSVANMMIERAQARALEDAGKKQIIPEKVPEKIENKPPKSVANVLVEQAQAKALEEASKINKQPEKSEPENQEPVLSPEGIPVVDKIDRIIKEEEDKTNRGTRRIELQKKQDDAVQKARTMMGDMRSQKSELEIEAEEISVPASAQLPDIKTIPSEIMQNGPDTVRLSDAEMKLAKEKMGEIVDNKINKTETLSLPGGREELVDNAIKEILDAEDNLKKREKSQSTFSKLVSGFKIAFSGAENRGKESDKLANVTKEYREAQADVDQKKEALNNLIKQYARGDIESGKEKAEAVNKMIADKMKLVDKRIEHKAEQMPNAVKKFKKTMDWWHKQKWYVQIGITAGLIGVGGIGVATGGIATLVGGVMTGVGVGLESLGATAGVEKIVDASQKKWREKQGLTKEATAEQIKTEFTDEMKTKEAPEQNKDIDVLLKGFDKYNVKLDNELGKVFKVENRQNIRKWATAISAGLLVGYMGASHAIAKGIDAKAVKTAQEAIGPVPRPAPQAGGSSASRMNEHFVTEAGKELRMKETIANAQNVEMSTRGVAEKGIEAVAKSAGETAGSLAKQVAENPDKFKAVVEAGSSQWKTAEGLLGEVEGLGFKSMELEQQSHFIDSIIKEVGKNDLVKTGEKLDFSKALGNKSFMEKLIERNKEIAKGTKEFINIGKNNAAIEKWAVANPGKALNTETVKGIISGSKKVAEKIVDKGIIDEAAKAGETFATSLKGVPTSAVAAEKATFEAIKTIGAGIKKLPEFAGESGVWAQTSDMSVYKFMEDSAKGAIEMSEKIGGVSNAVSKRAMTGEEAKVIKLLRDYIIKIGDIGGKAGRPGKGQTVMEYINAFRAKNGRPLYNGLGEFVSKVKSGDMPIRV